jgi:hypothetical protein
MTITKVLTVVFILTTILGCSSARDLAQNAVNLATQRKDFLHLSPFSSAQLLERFMPDHDIFVTSPGNSTQSIQREFEYDMSVWVLSFQLLGWTGKTIRIETIEEMPLPKSQEAHSHTYRFNLQAPYTNYFAEIWIWKHDGQDYIAKLVWDHDTMKAHIRPLLDQYDRSRQ